MDSILLRQGCGGQATKSRAERAEGERGTSRLVGEVTYAEGEVERGNHLQRIHDRGKRKVVPCGSTSFPCMPFCGEDRYPKKYPKKYPEQYPEQYPKPPHQCLDATHKGRSV